MPKYVIWDKKSDIYMHLPSPKSGKMHWTAQEYIENEAPWAGQPYAKVIISGTDINGGFFLDFYERVQFYKSQGLEIHDKMTDNEILQAMEEFDNKPPEDALDLVTRISELENIIELMLGGEING